MNDEIKVSVIVPVYNVEEYLSDCLDSLINQSLKEIEIICVNDESTDNSLSILEEYANKDNRIKIISQRNKGLGGARNTGMDNITGEYTIFIDSDDWIEEDTLKELYDLASDLDADIVMYLLKTYNQSTKTFDGSSDITLDMIDSSLDNSVFNYKDIIDVLFKVSHSACNKLYKVSFLNSINARFIEKFKYEDLPFFYQVFLKAERVSILRKPFYVYRIRDNSICTSGDQGSYDIFKGLNIVKQSLIENKIYDTYKQDFLMFIIVNIKFVFIRLNEIYRNEFFDILCKNYENFELDTVDSNEVNKWHFDDRVFYQSISKAKTGDEFYLIYRKEYYKVLSNHYKNLSLHLQSENDKLINENNTLKSKPSKVQYIKNIFRK